MSDETTICQVASCLRPSDGWIVCQHCGDVFVDMLTEVPWMLDQLEIVVLGQTKYTRIAAGKSAERPLPVNLKASDTRDALANEITTSARMIAEVNGWEFEAATTKQAALWLAHRVSAVRLHVAGGEVVDGISRWYAAAMYVIDRPLMRQFLGDCGESWDGEECSGRIYGKQGKPEARCDTCGSVYEAEALRKWLLMQAMDRLMTSAEIGDMSPLMGTGSPDRMQNRIYKWHQRGRITSRGVRENSPLFRFGEVYDLLTEQGEVVA